MENILYYFVEVTSQTETEAESTIDVYNITATIWFHEVTVCIDMGGHHPYTMKHIIKETVTKMHARECVMLTVMQLKRNMVERSRRELAFKDVSFIIEEDNEGRAEYEKEKQS